MLWNMQLKILCDIHVINNYSFILSMQLYYTTMATTISKVLTELPQHKNVGELTCLGSGVVITWEFQSSFTLLKLHTMAHFFLTPILCGIMCRLSILSLQCYHYIYNMDLYDLVELGDIMS